MPALANMAKGSIGQAILCEPSQWIVGMASLHAKLIKHHRWHDVDQGIDRPTQRGNLLDETAGGVRMFLTGDHEDGLDVCDLAIRDGQLTFGCKIGDVANTTKNCTSPDFARKVHRRRAAADKERARGRRVEAQLQLHLDLLLLVVRE